MTPRIQPHQPSNTSTNNNGIHSVDGYVELSPTEASTALMAAMPPPSQETTTVSLTPHELIMLRQMLHNATSKNLTTTASSADDTDADSEYSEFPETTHAWAVFADKPQRKATKMDRIVGTSIIIFQLFAYSLFVKEAVEDYQQKSVPVLTTHQNCLANNGEPQQNFVCEAEFTSHVDALVAFFMLSIFLTPEILQAARAIVAAPLWSPTMMFAGLAGLEVVFAFLAATIAISYQLFIGEVTDAIEVGVGLLFIRELSARAYHGIRHKGVKQYKSFFGVLIFLLLVGFLVETLCEVALAPDSSTGGDQQQ